MVQRSSSAVLMGVAAIASGGVSGCATVGPAGPPAPVEYRVDDPNYGSAPYSQPGYADPYAQQQAQQYYAQPVANAPLGVMTPSDLRGPLDPRSSPDTMIVEGGETLFDVSRRYQIPLEALIAENRLQPPYALDRGQVLQLPEPNIYVVRAGDTFWTVADKFSIDPHSLARLNRVSKPYMFIEGQEVVLPAGAVARRDIAQRPATKPMQNAGDATAPSREAMPTVGGATAGRFIWPVSGKVLRRFGEMPNGQRSDGLQIEAAEGTPIRSVDAGIVVYAGNDLPGYGNLVLVKHEGGWISAYASARRILAKEGAKVMKGDVIAEVGSTGRAKVSSLHFELRRGPRPVDPLSALPKA